MQGFDLNHRKWENQLNHRKLINYLNQRLSFEHSHHITLVIDWLDPLDIIRNLLAIEYQFFYSVA